MSDTNCDASDVGQDGVDAGQGGEQGFVQFGFGGGGLQAFVRGQSADQATDGWCVFGDSRAERGVRHVWAHLALTVMAEPRSAMTRGQCIAP